MSLKRWLALLLFYISYLFFGASIYYFIEHTEEIEHRAIELIERNKINVYITENLKGDDDQKNEILVNITEYCGKKVTAVDPNELQDPFRWSFYHAFFFAFTVCSTVGYGNLAPSTTLGQMILIGYSLIGMPVNTILFAGLGEFFGRLFRDIHIRYKNYKMSNDILYIPRQFGLIATITMALIPGIFFFIILPSCIFSYFEGWPFSLSIYYSYVTTTTIGFGDYVPTFQPHQERYFGGWFVVYQIFVIVWFIFSLGYLLMIMGFITKGLRSKKLRNLQHQLKVNIKNTQNRIWNGVVKDVGYLRKILNEVYINVKPIYNEPGYREPYDICRSLSCPDLSMYKSTSPILSRKRALSESYSKFMKDGHIQVGQGTPVNRSSSDTDLNKINKEKTFETVNAFRETTNLLAKVVSALSNIQPSQYETGQETSSLNSGSFGGYHGFSDSQILSDEILPISAQNDNIPHHRARASSDFFINPKTIPVQNQHNEWTWCGDNDKIQQEINDRARFYKNNNLAKTALYKTALNNSVILNVESKEDIAPQKKKKLRKFSSEFVLDLFRRRSSGLDVSSKNQRKQSTDIINQIPPSSLGEKYQNVQNNYATVSSNNSSLKSENKSGLKSLNNVSIEGLPPTSQDYNRQEINQMKHIKQRKGSLYPFYSNNVMNESKDPFNLRKSLPHRNSIFNKINRSGSLAFPITEGNRVRTFSLNNESRKSIDSICSDRKSEDILENTSIADLIRALEVLHTRAATSEPTIPEETEEKVKKKRKFGTFTPPKLSPLFTIFSNDSNLDNKEDEFNEIRPTPTAIKNTLGNIRRSSVYNESGQFNKRDQQPTDINKYGRRFSVRPAELQTPPGTRSQYSIGGSGVSGGISNQSISSFPTALQRRLSIRLSKDFNRPGTSPFGTGNTGTGSGIGSSNTSSLRNSTRKQFLPGSSNKPSQTNINRNFNSNENSDC